MKHHYRDIRALTLLAPSWWDENGVPRYCVFGPRETANIYASEAVLLKVRCQNCGRLFRVCLSWSSTDRIRLGAPSLEERVRAGTVHYGDPPNADCCPSGPTMNSEAERVLEFWRSVDCRWVRAPELEVELPDEEGA